MFDVYLHEKCVGLLQARGRGLRFTYTPRALELDTHPPLSLSLPKRARPYADSEAGPFFRNLLPEQAYRRLVATAARTAPENSLLLLGAIGGECPGAVSIWPKDIQPPTTREYEALTDARLKDLFSRQSRAPLATAVTRGRLSLPGVQEKIALLRRDDTWHLPLKGAVTSHILKQATEAFRFLLENELFCMSLASRTGLDVPDISLATPDVRVFCTERFDRVRPTVEADPPIEKLHQEDFCQILRVDPQNKYERDGGPGIRTCSEVIRRYSSLPAEDLIRLARWIGFNYVIGNEDAHAKNLALLYTPEGLRLSPHYDLVSTEVYPELERSQSMKIGGAWDIRNVQRNDWVRFAKNVGLPENRVRVLLLEVADLTKRALPDVTAMCEARFGDSPIYTQIADVVSLRSDRLHRELAAQT